MNNQPFFSPWRQLMSGLARAGASVCLLVLGACSATQNPSELDASSATAVLSQPAQSEEMPTNQLPAEILGTFDISQEACSASSMTRLTIAPSKLDFYYGFANIDSVAFQDAGYDISATLFHQEGQVEVVPESVTYRIEPSRSESSEQGDRIRFENSWTDAQPSLPSLMVRCIESDSQPLTESSTYNDAITPDKTVELTFASGASSATVSDTIDGFNFHDYLVRASANQTLTATLESDGPAMVIVLENDGYQPDAVRSLPAQTQEAITDSTGQSQGWLWEGTLPSDGVYRVRVIHSGPAANQDAVSPYTLTVEIEP